MARDMNQLKVFISYRRSDTQHVAGRLGDRIGTRFTLFMDDDIPRVDFTTVVRRAIDESDVLLVLIGPHFLGVGADGERRLDKSGDWVAEEVGTGLARDIAVVPVLVDGAQMPSAAELPGKLKALAHRQALRLTHVSFNSDAERLIETLDDIERRKFGATEPPRRDPSPQPAPGDLFGDPDYSRAIAAAFNRRWVQAIQLFEAVDRRFPEDDRVRGPLAEARRGLHIEQLEAQAAEAERDGTLARGDREPRGTGHRTARRHRPPGSPRKGQARGPDRGSLRPVARHVRRRRSGSGSAC